MIPIYTQQNKAWAIVNEIRQHFENDNEGWQEFWELAKTQAQNRETIALTNIHFQYWKDFDFRISAASCTVQANSSGEVFINHISFGEGSNKFIRFSIDENEICASYVSRNFYLQPGSINGLSTISFVRK